MRNLFLAALLLLPAAAQAQPDALEFETVHSEALRPTLGFETVIADADWISSGSRPRDYQFGVGSTEGMLGKEAFLIQARPNAYFSEYGTLMQKIPADVMRGTRIKLTARLKSENVRALQLWMRVDGRRGAEAPLGFYNMADRQIRGTQDWQRYEIVLDVPPGSIYVAYGFVLGGGQGRAWADGFTLEAVGEDVPVSRMQFR